MTQIKCKKCGEINKSTAKFCKSCGADLSIKGNKCPKCGKINDFDNKFCEHCGSPMNYQEEVIEREVESKPTKKDEVKIVYANKKEVTNKPVEKSKEVISNNGVKINYANGSGTSVKEHAPSVQLNDKAAKYISLGTRILFLVALLFATIGIFGAFAKGDGTTVSPISSKTSLGFTYFFGDLWDDLKLIKDAKLPNYGFFAFLNVLHLLTYVVLVIGVIYSICKTVGCFIKDTKLETLNIKKVSKVLLVTIIPFIILTSVLYSASSKASGLGIEESRGVGFGWGAILLIISLFSLIFVDEYKELNKSYIIVLSLKKIAMVLMLVVVVVGFGNVLYAKQNAEYSISICYSAGITLVSPNSISSIIVLNVSMLIVLLFLILYFTRKNNKPRIVFNIILVVFFVSLTILSTNAAKDLFRTMSDVQDLSKYVSAAPVCIVSIVFTVISSILNIVSNRLENK